jgi:hypothetical protein
MTMAPTRPCPANSGGPLSALPAINPNPNPNPNPCPTARLRVLGVHGTAYPLAVEGGPG